MYECARACFERGCWWKCRIREISDSLYGNMTVFAAQVMETKHSVCENRQTVSMRKQPVSLYGKTDKESMGKLTFSRYGKAKRLSLFEN